MKGLKRWRIKNGGGWNVKGYGGAMNVIVGFAGLGSVCVCVWGGGGGGGWFGVYAQKTRLRVANFRSP